MPKVNQILDPFSKDNCSWVFALRIQIPTRALNLFPDFVFICAPTSQLGYNEYTAHTVSGKIGQWARGLATLSQMLRLRKIVVNTIPTLYPWQSLRVSLRDCY